MYGSSRPGTRRGATWEGRAVRFIGWCADYQKNRVDIDSPRSAKRNQAGQEPILIGPLLDGQLERMAMAQAELPIFG